MCDQSQSNSATTSPPADLDPTQISSGLEPGSAAVGTSQASFSETTSTALLEKAADILLVLDCQGAFRYASPSSKRILGYEPAEVIGQLATDFVHPADVAAVRHVISQALAHPGKSQRLSDYRVRRADGSWCFFEATATNLLDDGAVAGVIVTCHDVTERKGSERILIERARLSKLEADIGAALAGGGNLAEVLDRCVTIVAAALQAPFVRLWTYDRESHLLELRAAVGPLALVQDPALAVAFPIRVPLGVTLAGLIAHQRQPYESNTIDQEPALGDVRSLLLAEGLTAFAGYPLIVDEQLIGVLALLGRQPLSSAERGALGWITSVLAVGIDRAWARADLVSQRETLLFRLAGQIGRSLEVDTVLQTVVVDVRSLLHVDRCLFAWFCPQPIAAERPARASTETVNPSANLEKQPANQPPAKDPDPRVKTPQALRKRPADPLVPIANDPAEIADGSYWHVVSEAARPGLAPLLGARLGNTAAALAPVLLQWGTLGVECSTRARIPAMREFLLALSARAGAIALVRGQQAGTIGALCCLQESTERTWSESELHLLQGVAGQLAIALDRATLYGQARDRAQQLEEALVELRSTQMQLIQTEKMSGLGRLVAGVAHEINNPIAFIHGNLTYARQYLDDLFGILDTYQATYPEPIEPVADLLAGIDLNFLKTDFKKLLDSMQMGTERIRQIVVSLKNFSRRGDRAGMKPTDLHAAIDNVLLILQHRFKANQFHPGVELIRQFGELPLVVCEMGQIEQALMNIIGNAIDALEDLPRLGRLEVATQTYRHDQDGQDWAEIRITDNGPGMNAATRTSLFDPFFTTKPLGKGTGLGLSIAYQIIVETHHGQIDCDSAPSQGTTFRIQLPVQGIAPQSS